MSDQLSEHDHIARQLETFIRDVGRIGPEEHGFTWRASLLEDGYLDSMGVMRLIDFIESTLEMPLVDEDLFSPEFTSIDSIAGILVRVRKEQARGHGG
jgi:acyl carrier protein